MSKSTSLGNHFRLRWFIRAYYLSRVSKMRRAKLKSIGGVAWGERQADSRIWPLLTATSQDFPPFLTSLVRLASSNSLLSLMRTLRSQLMSTVFPWSSMNLWKLKCKISRSWDILNFRCTTMPRSRVLAKSKLTDYLDTFQTGSESAVYIQHWTWLIWTHS